MSKKSIVWGRCVWILFCLWGSFVYAEGIKAHPLADKVIVLANSEVGDSVTVARRYQEARGIPEKNVILLPMPEKGTINREIFTEQIYNPLLRELVKRGLIEGTLSEEKDVLGRLKLDVFFCDVEYMVTCMGVPYRIAGTPLEDGEVWDAYVERAKAKRFRYQMPAGPFKKNNASVDSDLATLAMPDIPLNGFVLNEDFGKIPADRASRLIRVTRLDGPSLTNVLGMIHFAIEAEEEGLKGRAYFDQDGRKGAYQEGNDWIAGAAEISRELGYDVSEDLERKEMGFGDRFDAPAIYFGWYAGTVNGAFLLPGFQFPKGAIAVHLHSFSAGEIRNKNKGWVGPLIDRGVTATLGNVYEPYLSHTHRFNIIMEGLRQGMNWADATYAGVISLSWQSLVIGDPLYTPFQQPIEAQVEALETSKDFVGDPYVVIRAINLLEAKGSLTEAKFLGLKYFYRMPNAALALRMAELSLTMGETSAIARRLEFALMIEDFEGQDWEVYRRIAQMLQKVGAGEKSILIYEHLLADKRIVGSYRKELIKEVLAMSKEVKATSSFVEWRRELSEMEAKEAQARAEAKRKAEAAEKAKTDQ